MRKDPEVCFLFIFFYIYTVGCVRFINNTLTNGFHVAVRLLSNRSQMTLKCGKNKKVAHEPLVGCVRDAHRYAQMTSSMICY